MFTISSVLMQLMGRGRLMSQGSSALFVPQNKSHTIPVSLLGMVKFIVPPMTYNLHKGMMGRIGIVGGCKEYTGAPYYAAISALKLGCDLSYVFCTEGSAPVIKSYSPELIVIPLLASSYADKEIEGWLSRLHCLVIGPGLGRESHIIQSAKNIVTKAKSAGIPLVIDADGLFMVTEDPSLISGYKKAILTPNKVEFERLYEKMIGNKPHVTDNTFNVSDLSRKLGNVTIVRKGEDDVISDGVNVLVCTGEGSPRRCGGQGDLLSGALGTFTYWAHRAADNTDQNENFRAYGPSICAAYAACLLTKQCNKEAYEKYQRSMTTPDMIREIQTAFESLFV